MPLQTTTTESRRGFSRQVLGTGQPILTSLHGPLVGGDLAQPKLDPAKPQGLTAEPGLRESPRLTLTPKMVPTVPLIYNHDRESQSVTSLLQ